VLQLFSFWYSLRHRRRFGAVASAGG
jgi:hypothetical protein